VPLLHEKTVSVVIPAYNEEALIGKVLETMPEFVDVVYVVDDCSTDGTSEVAREYEGRLNGRLVIIRHERNRGVGAAIVTGYKRAVADRVAVTAVMAGDGQMDPSDLERVVTPVLEGRVAYCKGNRLFTPRAWQIIPRHRYLGNAFLSFLTKIASGYWHVADSQTGYAAISLEALEAIQLDNIYARYGYPNDMLVHLNVYDFRVADVPVHPVYGQGEKSKMRAWRIIPTLSWLMAKRFLWRLKEKYVIRDFHPLVLFYALGSLLFGVGAAFGLYLLIYRILCGPVEGTSAVFSGFLIIAGLQMLLFAMWFDMESNRHLK